MKNLIITIILFASASAYAQTQKKSDQNTSKTDYSAGIRIEEPIPKDTTNYPPEKIFYQVQIQPKYPGGMDKFLAFIKSNLIIPASSAPVTARAVVSFVVEPNGTLTNIKVLRAPTKEHETEAVRLMGLMPKWLPGKHNDKPVRVSYTIPISFKKD